MKSTFWNLLKDYSIEIPIMQRDYAQGRDDDKAKLIRQYFLRDIKKALDEQQPLNLDFVYGSVQGTKMLPLDGQQRLTTLFLLHWWAAAKSGHGDEARELLCKFSYQTRTTSKQFCKRMVCFSPQPEDGGVSGQIKNQEWFFKAWEQDPTVKSMLTMLDAIEKEFGASETNYYDRLTQKELVVFEHLKLTDFGLTDNLYIKMNARGKPLTEFENFKARFEGFLEEKYPDRKKEFAQKADGKWLDLFWNDTGERADEAFMNYIGFIAEAGSYVNGVDKLSPSDIAFKLQMFEKPNTLDLLFKSLDALVEEQNREEYFLRYFTPADGEYEPGKVKLYAKDVNLWKQCLFLDKQFTIANQLIFYGVLLQLSAGGVKSHELRRLRNLILNTPGSLYADKAPTLYKTVHGIMAGAGYDAPNSIFSGPQIAYEKRKDEFLALHPEMRDQVNHFEDHRVLRGCLSAFDLDAQTLPCARERFEQLFEKGADCNKIHRALLCFGEYSQLIKGDRWRLANDESTWNTIFTAEDVSKIRNAMRGLLAEYPAVQLDEIIERYLKGRENEEKGALDYYFIKYGAINKHDVCYEGTYLWSDDESDLRMISKSMLTSWWVDPRLWAVYMSLDKSLRNDLAERDVLVCDRDVRKTGGDMRPMTVCGIEISWENDGWCIEPAGDASQEVQVKYDALCAQFGIDGGMLELPLTEDRIPIAVDIVKYIVG